MHLGHQGAVQALELVEILQLIRLVFEALKVVRGVAFGRLGEEGGTLVSKIVFLWRLFERKKSIF